MEKEELKKIIVNQFQIHTLLGAIYDKANNGDLGSFVDDFKNSMKIDLKEYSLYNQHTMISSLYTFIALPKEVIWDSLPKNLLISDLDYKWGLNNGWKINNGVFSKLRFRYLIRRLRNGINHGEVKCNEELNFTIIDTNQKDKNDRVEFKIEFNYLSMFIRALGWWIITNDIKLKNFILHRVRI